MLGGLLERSRFWRGLERGTVGESRRVLIEEQRGDEDTPAVPLATSTLLAGLAGARLRPLMQGGAGREGVVRGGREVDCLGKPQHRQVQGGTLGVQERTCWKVLHLVRQRTIWPSVNLGLKYCG